VQAWALEKDVDPSRLKSNSFELEWPPKSEKILQVPEADKGEWFTVAEAKKRINTGQTPLIDELMIKIGPEG